ADAAPGRADERTGRAACPSVLRRTGRAPARDGRARPRPEQLRAAPLREPGAGPAGHRGGPHVPAPAGVAGPGGDAEPGLTGSPDLPPAAVHRDAGGGGTSTRPPTDPRRPRDDGRLRGHGRTSPGIAGDLAGP